jgi:hypothetical protein
MLPGGEPTTATGTVVSPEGRGWGFLLLAAEAYDAAERTQAARRRQLSRADALYRCPPIGVNVSRERGSYLVAAEETLLWW